VRARRPRLLRATAALAALALACGPGGEAPDAPGGGDEAIVLASTTSTRDSGLLDAILPIFEAEAGIAVRVVAVGTGRALDLARRGDADVLFVHDRASEEAFVEEGHGIRRRPVMYNDFVVVGPPDDPAGVRGLDDVADALARVAASRAPFFSRGDESGTHKAELRLWTAAGLEPSAREDAWYRETGAGMGATLNTANQAGGYALTDRGTWLAFRNRARLDLLVEGDPRLRNEYGVIVVSPERHPHVNAAAATRLADWLVSEEGRAAIAAFRVEGEPLFFPIAP
jgi:tungstate transport system substrate-binding protein